MSTLVDQARIDEVERLLNAWMENDPDAAKRFIESQLARLALRKRLEARQLADRVQELESTIQDSLKVADPVQPEKEERRPLQAGMNNVELAEAWRKRKEPHEGALVGDQIPPCHLVQHSTEETAWQTGESGSIVGDLNNLEQAALDAYNEHFYKCSPSCSVATWTSAWRKGIDWFNNMPGGQSVTAVIAEKQAAEGWRPIETAPKDVPLILYGAKRLEMCVGMFHSRDGWVTDTTSEWVNMYPPTHWRPLPAPPATQGGAFLPGEYERMTENGRKAWEGVDPQDLRAGNFPQGGADESDH